MRGRSVGLCWLVLILVASSRAGAQVQLERFFPPVLSTGQTTQIQAEGKFPAWPPQIACDRSDVQISAGKESGVLHISVPEGAAPGVAWIRFFDEISASKLVPILVERIACSSEVEANDEWTTAQVLDLPVAIGGRLEKNDDVDAYRLNLEKGQNLVATLVANQVLGSPMDAVMQITDLEGNVLAQTDDELGLDPQIAFQSAEGGPVVLRVFAFPETPNSSINYAGGADYLYLLRLSSDTVTDHCLPIISDPDEAHFWAAQWNSQQAHVPCRIAPKTDISPRIVFAENSAGWQWADSVPFAAAHLESDDETIQSFVEWSMPDASPTPPLIFSGHIAQEGEVDRYRFQVVKGVKYEIQVYARNYGFVIDSVIRVIDCQSGKELGNNDDLSRRDYDSRLEFTAQETGELEVQISDLAESASLRHAYSIGIWKVAPAIRMTVGAEQFDAKAGANFEIPITIERTQGFKEPLQFHVEGLPDGITLKPFTSESSKASETVKLELTIQDAACVGQHRFEVTASTLNEPTVNYRVEHALRPAVRINRFWLTVKPDKPSQGK